MNKKLLLQLLVVLPFIGSQQIQSSSALGWGLNTLASNNMKFMIANGWIINSSGSTLYYGAENSSSLKSVLSYGHINPNNAAKLEYAIPVFNTPNHYLIYQSNSANGPALWIDFKKSLKDSKKLEVEVYMCNVKNGKVISRGKNPVPGVEKDTNFGKKKYLPYLEGVYYAEIFDAPNMPYIPLIVNPNENALNYKITPYDNVPGSSTSEFIGFNVPSNPESFIPA